MMKRKEQEVRDKLSEQLRGFKTNSNKECAYLVSTSQEEMWLQSHLPGSHRCGPAVIGLNAAQCDYTVTFLAEGIC